MKEYVIEGSEIKNLEDLFLVFANFSTLKEDDYRVQSLLEFDFRLNSPDDGIENPCKIIWKDWVESKACLNSGMLIDYCLELLQHPEENFPDLELGIAEISKLMEQANSEGRTMFDEIFDIISTVRERTFGRKSLELILLEEKNETGGLDGSFAVSQK